MIPFFWRVRTNYMWDDEKILIRLGPVKLIRRDLWCQDCGTWKYWFAVTLS